MSKKKNTLKDLDEFLKQQAATLVTPTPLSEKVEEKPAAKATVVTPPVTPIAEEISLEKILDDLETLSQKEGTTFRKKICDLILQSYENSHHSSPEDKMLINTILYINGGAKWKDTVREYWRNK